MNNGQLSLKEFNYSFDFLRIAAVLGVILFHAASAYSNMGAGFWPVQDAKNSVGSGLNELLDVFIMPFFLFIAGYFALPSIRNKTFSGFFFSKFKRLYIYWVFIVLIFIPLMIYFMLRSFLHSNLDYYTHWLNSLLKVRSISNNNNLATIGQNGHMHFWFVSFLFYIFILFGLIYKLYHKFFSGKNIPANKSNKGINIIHLLVFGILTTLTYFVFLLLFTGADWAIIPNILQFKTTHLPVLLLFFGFGVYSNYKQWFTKNGIPFNIATWTISSILLTIIFFIVGQNFFDNAYVSTILSPFYLFIFSIIRSFLILSYLMLSLLLANKYFNKKNIFINKYSDTSFEIYLVHLFPVVFFQGFFLNFNKIPINILPVTVKIFAVFILATVTSYFIGKYTLYKFPKTIGFIFIAGFALMMIFYR